MATEGWKYTSRRKEIHIAHSQDANEGRYNYTSSFSLCSFISASRRLIAFSVLVGATFRQIRAPTWTSIWSTRSIIGKVQCKQFSTHNRHETAESQGPCNTARLRVMLLDESSSGRRFAIDPFEDQGCNQCNLSSVTKIWSESGIRSFASKNSILTRNCDNKVCQLNAPCISEVYEELT